MQQTNLDKSTSQSENQNQLVNFLFGAVSELKDESSPTKMSKS